MIRVVRLSCAAGQDEDHIKMIKRQMLGRASLPLLRKRVLLTAQN